MRSALLVLLPIAVLLAELVAVEYADPDLWGRISVGAVLSQTGALPVVDDFSFTAAGREWIDHEWLAGVVFHGLLTLGGEAALVAFKYAVASASLLLVFAIHRRAGAGRPPLAASLSLVLLSPVILLGFLTTVRAQVFSLFAFLLVIAVLEGVRTERSRPVVLWWLVPLTVVWGNAHGGFVLGVLAVGLYAGAALVERRGARALVFAAVASAMLAGVACLNPYGLRYGEFLLHAWTLDRSAISEWRPLLRAPQGPVLALALVSVAAATALGVGRVVSALRAAVREPAAAGARLLGPALVLLLLVAMTWLSQRIQSFLALGLVALLPALAPEVVRRIDVRGRGWLGWAAGGLVTLPIAFLILRSLVAPGLSAAVPQLPLTAGDSEVAYPVGAARWLRDSPYEGRVLNAFTPGEFLLWTLYPKFRIAMDGRYEEVYTQEEFRAVREFFTFEAALRPGDDPERRRRSQREAKETLRFAQRSGADFVLMRSQWRVRRVLEASPLWRTAYDDETFAVLVHHRLGHVEPPVLPRGAPPRVSIRDFTGPAETARFGVYPASSEEIARRQSSMP